MLIVSQMSYINLYPYKFTLLQESQYNYLLRTRQHKLTVKLSLELGKTLMSLLHGKITCQVEKWE